MARTQPSKDIPSWLHAGAEVCFSCGQLYVYEMERRCGHCDAPLCWLCALSHDGDQIVCSDCCQGGGE